MSQNGAQAYELSHVRSPTMPLSPFAGPYAVKPQATALTPEASAWFQDNARALARSVRRQQTHQHRPRSLGQ